MMLRWCAAIAITTTAVLHAQPDPPAAAGAWTLSVAETGGFVGGSSTVTVTSEGQVTVQSGGMRRGSVGGRRI